MARDPRLIAEERQRIMQTIRSFLCARGYLEVETPILLQSPGMEPNLVPFQTMVYNQRREAFPAALATSPEYSMKKLLGQGFEKIFSLTKVFRNEEEFGHTHNHEFTMMEWYTQGADHHAMMAETEALLQAVAQAFGKVWPRFQKKSVRELFLQYVGIDLAQSGKKDVFKRAEELGVKVDPLDTEGDVFYRLFLQFVEPQLPTDPVFVYDYPAHQASLARLDATGRFGERAELYINRLELSNGFTELTNATEQRARFEEEAKERAQAGKQVFPIDEEFLRLLPSVRTPTFGNALGIDRLHMALLQTENIEDVILFPIRKLFS
jgi:lysyl-tRNA synthetase class 2